ncbi:MULTISPECIES: hypothetical protein [unclassified Corynebacterium]|uniref:hypothetical protein n=1 Tax=unclassified Corynebacterium TaxID=2624378 RepID=UPI0026471687|nr:hypothetical protein [Corynebacterium sp.]MDN5582736.1 hypothetical protein [Corynebacterium sp.]MDN5719543.1 hypothetical protein [Corynebacterium sp.]MDN6259363.1 hypothetical protein [Corynebacterium sp.]
MSEPTPVSNSVAQVVFRHDPTAAPQWTYYGINAPMTGSAQKLSEAKYAANRDLQFLSGEEKPAMRSYAEWAVDQETSPEAMPHGGSHGGPPSGPGMFVRSLQDEDTNQRLHRQNLAQAYLEGIRSTPEIRSTLPALVAGDTGEDDSGEDAAGADGNDGAEGPSDVILVTLFPHDLLGDALLNLTAMDTVIFCLPDGDSLGFLPVAGTEVWPTDGSTGMLERFGLDEFATVQDLMDASDGDGVVEG